MCSLACHGLKSVFCSNSPTLYKEQLFIRQCRVPMVRHWYTYNWHKFSEELDEASHTFQQRMVSFYKLNIRLRNLHCWWYLMSVAFVVCCWCALAKSVRITLNIYCRLGLLSISYALCFQGTIKFNNNRKKYFVALKDNVLKYYWNEVVSRSTLFKL